MKSFAFLERLKGTSQMDSVNQSYASTYDGVRGRRQEIEARVTELKRIIANLRTEVLKLKDEVAVNNLLQILVAQENLVLPEVPDVESLPILPPTVLFGEEGFFSNLLFNAKWLLLKKEQKDAMLDDRKSQVEEGVQGLNEYNETLDEFENNVIQELDQVRERYRAILSRLKTLESLVLTKTESTPQYLAKASNQIISTFTVPFIGRFIITNDVSVGQTIGALKTVEDFNAVASTENGKIPQLVIKVIDSVGNKTSQTSSLGNAYWTATYYGLPLNENIISGTEIASGTLFKTGAIPKTLDRDLRIIDSVPFAKAGNSLRDKAIAMEIFIQSEGAITVETSTISMILDKISTLDTNAAEEVTALRTEGAKNDLVTYYSSTSGGRELTQLLFSKVSRRAGRALRVVLERYFQGFLTDHNELEIALNLLSYGEIDILNQFLQKQISPLQAYDKLLAVTPKKDAVLIEAGAPTQQTTSPNPDNALIVTPGGAKTLAQAGFQNIDEGSLIAADTLASLLGTNFMLGYLGNAEVFAEVRQQFGSITSETVIAELKVAIQQGKITKLAFEKALADLVNNEQSLADEHSKEIIAKAKAAIAEQVKQFEPTKITPEDPAITKTAEPKPENGAK